jgi:hypothetical protein
MHFLHYRWLSVILLLPLATYLIMYLDHVFSLVVLSHCKHTHGESQKAEQLDVAHVQQLACQKETRAVLRWAYLCHALLQNATRCCAVLRYVFCCAGRFGHRAWLLHYCQ